MMRRVRNARPIAFVLPVAAVALVLLYQNCGDGGYAYDPQNSQLSSGGVGNGNGGSNTGAGATPPPANSGAFAITLYAAGGTVLPANMALDPGFAYDIRASGQNVSTANITWTVLSTSTAACSLTSNGVSTRRDLKCVTTGTVNIRADASWLDGTVAVATLNRSVTGNQPGGGGGGSADPNLVEFRIRAGTGNGAWNTAAAAVLVFPGQTLRIFNDDTIAHRLRTPGTPCLQQPTNMAPNQSYDCVINSAHAANATDLYDFNAGAAAVFYVNSMDGQALYGTACASCHGAFGVSAKRGASFTGIKNAIVGNVGGMGNINLNDNQLSAIAYALSR